MVSLIHLKKYFTRLTRECVDKIDLHEIIDAITKALDMEFKHDGDDYERLCKFFGTKIVILDNTDGDKSKQQEITENLISIIHHFSMRIYSNRKRKKLIDLVQSK